MVNKYSNNSEHERTIVFEKDNVNHVEGNMFERAYMLMFFLVLHYLCYQ